MKSRHLESHRINRIGWLRAAVLGANDGIVSVSSLVVGMAASPASDNNVLLAGVAGLFAGAISMAAGEYVSVGSQADTEKADLTRERQELESMPEHELEELTVIYQKRGLSRELAARVAEELTARDALAAHARDELGITESLAARPVQAAVFSAVAFAAGGIVPTLLLFVVPRPFFVLTASGISLILLGVLGSVAARAGGAPVLKSVVRVVFWGVLAMGITAGVGKLFGLAGI